MKMNMNKRGAMSLVDHWVDYLALVVLILGAILAFAGGSLVVTYATIFICGLIIGRCIYKRQHRLKIRFYYPLIAFLIGYVVASRFGTYKGIIIWFVVGAVCGSYIHRKKWMP